MPVQSSIMQRPLNNMKKFLQNILYKLNNLLFTRAEKAIVVKNNAVNDFFGGWQEEDLDLLSCYQITEAVAPDQGEIIDWLGIRTSSKMHSWLVMPEAGALIINELPVPDDQVHAETIEYVALLTSIERALKLGGTSFTAIELGASYAPWAVAAGVVALRKKFAQINLVAVEANKDMLINIEDHARRNNLIGLSDIDLRAVHGAIYVDNKIVYFPKVDVTSDNGGQITSTILSKDYRGLEYEYDPVDGFTLAELAKNYEHIDFLHMDVQGAELMLLGDDSFVDTLDKKVSTFFLATQSRLIEGVALQKLSALGWVLKRERPTIYRQNGRTSDINGWTLRDGGQLWLNPRFSDYGCIP